MKAGNLRALVRSHRMASAALVLVLLAGGGTAWTSHVGSPEYSLRHVQKAVEAKNRLRFESVVDLDRVLHSAVDQMLAQATAQSMSEGEGLEALGAALGSSLVAQMKPALIQALRSSILGAVDQGDLAAAWSQRDSSSAVNPAAMADGIGVAPAQFAGVNRTVREGDIALVGLRFRQDLLDTTLVLNLRMERAGKRWRIVAVENLDVYMRDLERLREAHLVTESDKERARLAEVLSFGPYQATTRSFFSISSVTVTQEVTNRGRHPVRLKYGWVRPPHGSGAEPHLAFPSVASLAPGEQATFSLSASTLGDAATYRALTGGLAGYTTDLLIVYGPDDAPELIGAYEGWDNYLERLRDPAGLAVKVRDAGLSSQSSNPLAALMDRAAAGNWTLKEDTDPLDDSPVVILSNEASSGRVSLGDAPTLLLRCQKGRSEAYINWGTYLGSDGTIAVSYRIGSAPQQRSRWGMSTSNRATFFPGRDIDFIKSLVEADRLVAQVTPYSESPVTAIFDLAGIQDHIGKLREACGW
jgi:hypothetical protein